MDERLRPMDRPAYVAKTVLVVDDHPEIRDVVEIILSLELGAGVVAAGDGLQALERIDRTVPDLIVTDIRMPRLDGCELTRRLKADPRTRHIPVIAISANDARQTALAAGCEEFVAKPFELEKLVGAARRFLAGGAEDFQLAG